jgi:phosphatidylinositol glycan class B
MFRTANVSLIRSQFDPDEYWQNLEPAYCHVFVGDDAQCPGWTWEWKRRRPISTKSNNSLFPMTALQSGWDGPVRSFVSILPTLIYYEILQVLQWDTAWMVARGPVVVNAVWVAATTDWTVWYMSQWWWVPQDDDDDSFMSVVQFCLYCSLSSWFHAYALVRTYSNALETALVSVSMALVSPEFLSNNNNKKHFIRRSCLAFFLGGLCAAIRFTCLTVYVPMGVLLSLRQKTRLATVHYLVGVCALSGILGLAVSLLVDRSMYGFWAFPMMGNFQFNVLQGNGVLYGTHPFHWYLTAGIPALTGMLCPILLYDLFRTTGWDHQHGRRNLWIVVATCVLAHSTSAHKEFRFLLPLLPLFCLLAGSRMAMISANRERSRTRLVLFLGAVANLMAVLYLGLVHQRAPIDVNRAILNLASAWSLHSGSNSFQVHYLMGCHSTPLLSHLHSPPLKFETWYLDCSPSCRADPDVDCESEAFAKDPAGFVQQTYLTCQGDEGGSSTSDNSCFAGMESSTRTIPNFVVCNAGELDRIRGILEHTMGLTEAGRFVQGVNGLRIGNLLTVANENMNNDNFSKISWLQGLVEISIEELVLYQGLQ